MLDINFIRENPETLDKLLGFRGQEAVAANLIALDDKRRKAVQDAQELQTTRNRLSKEIGQAKGKGDDAEADRLMKEVAELKEALKQAEEAEKLAAETLQDKLAHIPNLPFDDVPVGDDEADNQIVREWGKPETLAYALEHFDIGEALKQMDFERAGQLSGARFVILKGQLALLERALGNFMLDIHTREFGYTEISPPVLVRETALFGTGQLPKFREDVFQTEEGLFLIPTAEVPLTNLVADSITPAEDLPLRVAGLTPCFRSEAGSAGRDTRGMIRQHQFSKVELVSLVTQEESEAELERMTHCAETILQKLNLPYRVMLLCTGDMGFSARKTYDLEVWLPGQNQYREISSCSNCGDFQARRMKARYRLPDDKRTNFIHTLNGSGLAVGRTLIAVLENYLQEDGRVKVPDCLQPYMNGLSHIG
ncbi:MAG: serine--tRNA ligase [Parvibaculales bacterium]